MYLIHLMTDWSATEIADFFKMDPSTVLYAYRRVKRKTEESALMRNHFKDLQYKVEQDLRSDGFTFNV